MKFRRVAYHSAPAIVLTFALLFLLQTHSVRAAAAPDLPAGLVKAVQGQAYIVGSAEAGRQPLAHGDSVGAWKTVTTADKSKLLLQWQPNILTSMGGLSTLFVSAKSTDRGEVADIQLIDGLLRVSTSAESGGALEPYSLTTPVATIEPESLNQDVDFVAEVYTTPSVTVTIVTVLRGRVRVRNLSVQGAGEQIVESCHNVYVEEGKPISNVGTVAGDVVGSLIAETTIEGTPLAQVSVCGVPQAYQPEPPPTPAPSGYVYLEDSDFVDLYPYDEIEILPPEYAGGPMICFLPGIGRWYLPYDIYRRWGFGPDVIRWYVIQVLQQRSLYYDNYYWNDFNARRHEYYDVLYAAKLAGNRHLIGDTLHRLDYLRMRRNLLARRIHWLRDRVRSLDRRFPGKGPNRAILDTMYNSFNSAKNISIANRFRNRLHNELQIQNRLAGNATQELIGLRTRVAQARDPRQRLQLRQNLDRFRSTIREGKLPLPEKQQEVKGLLATMAKTKEPEQFTTLQNQFDQKLGRPAIMQHAAVVNQTQMNELKQSIARVNPLVRQHADKKLQDLERAVQQRREIQTAQQKIDKAMSEAASTKNEAQREQLLRQARELARQPFKGTLKGPLQALQEQQRLQAQMLGATKGREQSLQRLRELTNKQYKTIPRPSGVLPTPTRQPEQVQGQPRTLERTQEEARRKQEEAARKAEELRRSKELGAQQRQKLREQQLQQQRLQEQQKLQQRQQQRQRELQQQKQQEQRLQEQRLQKQRATQERQKLQQQQRLQEQRQQEQRLRQQRQQEQRLQQQRLQQQQQLQRQQQLRQQQMQQQRLQQQRLQQQQQVQRQQQLQRSLQQPQRTLPARPGTEERRGGPPLR